LAGVAGSLVELAGIAERESIEMTLVRMSSRDGERVLAVELELLLDDPIGLLGDFAFYRPVEDIVGDVFYFLRELGGRDDLVDLRERRFVVGPVESLFESFFFREREVLLGYGFVVAEGRNARREEFSPLPGLPHVLDDPRDEYFVLVPRILLIEDAILFVVHIRTAEAMLGTRRDKAIQYLRSLGHAAYAECDAMGVGSNADGIVNERCVLSP
jgi:hypothetical protein